MLHNSLLRGVFHAPLTFFDTTPTGRILSRFGKDVDELDTALPRNLSSTVGSTFQVNF